MRPAYVHNGGFQEQPSGIMRSLVNWQFRVARESGNEAFLERTDGAEAN